MQNKDSQTSLELRPCPFCGGNKLECDPTNILYDALKELKDGRKTSDNWACMRAEEALAEYEKIKETEPTIWQKLADHCGFNRSKHICAFGINRSGNSSGEVEYCVPMGWDNFEESKKVEFAEMFEQTAKRLRGGEKAKDMQPSIWQRPTVPYPDEEEFYDKVIMEIKSDNDSYITTLGDSNSYMREKIIRWCFIDELIAAYDSLNALTENEQ